MSLSPHGTPACAGQAIVAIRLSCRAPRMADLITVYISFLLSIRSTIDLKHMGRYVQSDNVVYTQGTRGLLESGGWSRDAPWTQRAD